MSSDKQDPLAAAAEAYANPKTPPASESAEAETKRETNSAAAFERLCNLPEHHVKDEYVNTLLIGNRRWAWGQALLWRDSEIAELKSDKAKEAATVDYLRDMVDKFTAERDELLNIRDALNQENLELKENSVPTYSELKAQMQELVELVEPLPEFLELHHKEGTLWTLPKLKALIERVKGGRS